MRYFCKQYIERDMDHLREQKVHLVNILSTDSQVRLLGVSFGAQPYATTCEASFPLWSAHCVLAAPLVIQLPANAPGQTTEDGSGTWPHHTCSRPRWGSRIVALDWTILGCLSYLGRKPADRFFFFFAFLFPFITLLFQ